MTGNGTLDGHPEPLSADAVRARLRPAGPFRSVEVVGQTGSTNADLLAAARSGAAEGAVLAAEEQTSGRGRLGRSWVSPPGAALTFSVLLRPDWAPPQLRGWVPLLAGVAVVGALPAGLPGLGLKWPNDVLAGDAKLAGILAEQVSDAIVVGVGLNVTAIPDGLPPGLATSLARLGASTDRSDLLARIMSELERWYLRWQQAGGDPDDCGLRAEYLRRCVTIGQQVRVELPGGTVLGGTASSVDGLGRLVLTTPAGQQPVSAGDVVHVR